MQVDEPATVNKGGLDAGDSLSDIARSIEKDMTPPHEPAAEERLAADEPNEPESIEEEADEFASSESLFGEHFESQDQDDDESYEYEEEEATDRDESQEEEQEEVEDEQPEPTVVVAAPRAAVTPPRAIPLTGLSEASESEQAPAEESLEVQAAPAVMTAPAMITVATSEPEQEEAYEEECEEDDIEEGEPYLALRNLATALRIFPALLIPVVLWYILAATTVPGAIVTLVGGGAVVAMTWTLAEIADAVRDIAMR